MAAIGAKNAMWRPKKVGDIVATRRFTLRKGSATKSAFLDVGRPVQEPKAKKGDPWMCPILIRGMGKEEFFYAAGIDGVQALTLALNLSMSVLPVFAGWRGYAIEFLDPKMPLIYDSWDLDDLRKAQKRHRKKFKKIETDLDELFAKEK